jgi:hypothetical protein
MIRLQNLHNRARRYTFPVFGCRGAAIPAEQGFWANRRLMGPMRRVLPGRRFGVGAHLYAQDKSGQRHPMDFRLCVPRNTSFCTENPPGNYRPELLVELVKKPRSIE